MGREATCAFATALIVTVVKRLDDLAPKRRRWTWLGSLGARLVVHPGTIGETGAVREDMTENARPRSRSVRPYSRIGVFVDTWWATRGGSAGLQIRQRERLADLVRYARTHSPFYADHYRRVPDDVEDARQLPPVNKNQLMERFDEWVCDRAITLPAVEGFIADPARIGEDFLGRYVIWTTSGTSGDPAILLQDRAALAVYTPVTIVRGYLTGSRPGRLLTDVAQVIVGGGRVATLLVTGGHHGGVVLVARAQRRHPRLARRNRLLSVLRPLGDLVDELNRVRPAVLHGYPSALTLLASEQVAGRLRIAPVLMGSTGETLTPPARRLIESAFGCRVRDTYGSSEAGGIAFECSERRLHVNSDWVIVEPVDHSQQPVIPGLASHSVLVTNLANRVQPIIRYDLGDSITWLTDPCACGSPLPSITVHGRADELLSLTRRDGDNRILPLALSTVAEDTLGVYRVQIVKTGSATLSVRFEVSRGADADEVWLDLETRLSSYLTDQGVQGVEIQRSPDPPVREASGKFRSVWTVATP